MKMYRMALFIGRFQPFHKGHLYSLKKAMEIGERVIVGVGSSNQKGTESNPFSYEVRKKMIEKVIEKYTNEQKSSISILPIPDTPSDEEWAGQVQTLIQNLEFRNKEQVVVVGNNEWVNELMEKAGYEVLRTGLYNRDKLEGVKIRRLILRSIRRAQGKQAQDKLAREEWRERVPEGVFDVLTKHVQYVIL